MKSKLILLCTAITLSAVMLSGCSKEEKAPSEGSTETGSSDSQAQQSAEASGGEGDTPEHQDSPIQPDSPQETEDNTPQWNETPVSGQLYVNTDGIFARIYAIQGSTTVRQYRLNDAVTVVARTDTDYYKLEDGTFIHADYLSETETVYEMENEDTKNEALPDYVSVTEKGYVIERKNGITYVDGIMIANKTYTLPADYDPGIKPEAANALAEMQIAAAAEGLTLYPISAYRSYNRQVEVYAGWVSIDGAAAADRYSSRPGYSDHQTGYTYDLNSSDTSFAYTAEGKWLAEHCAEFGFIIRYPEGKEAYTGYIYEPWHVRWIGVEKAKIIMASGLSLEEYYGFPSSYDISGDYFV